MTVSGRDLVPSDVVVARARTLGQEGERWLLALPGLVDAVVAEWQLTVEGVLPGASAGLVLAAHDDRGRSCVLKVFVPEGATGAAPFRQEMRALALAGGDPYVEVYRSDLERGVVLFERLGRPLGTLPLSVEEQLVIVAQTLRRGWREGSGDLPDGGEKAASLRRFIESMWSELGQPCGGAVVDAALAYAHSRESAYDPTSAVLVHGDAHRMNVLEADPSGSPGPFKLIDPEGLTSEPAHDLAIVLRELNREALTGDPASLLRSWCALLGSTADVDPQPIWEWSFIERVSTGLLLLHLGQLEEGRDYLTTAEAVVAKDGVR